MNKIEKLYRRIFILTFSMIFLLLLTSFLVVFLIDPYQQFRKSDKYINNARMEIPGISKYHNYNAALLGSSMAMNNNHRLVDSLFSTKDNRWITRNFTLIGGMCDDYDIILERLKKDKKIKHVIFDIDFFSFAKKRYSMSDYLYSDNCFDKLKYVFNYTTICDCVNKIKKPWEVDSLYHFESGNSKQILIESYKHAIRTPLNDEGYDFSFETMKENFLSYFFHHVTSMSDVDWYIYFPPYSAFEFVRYRDEGYITDMLNFKQYVFQMLLACENVKLYDFQSDQFYVMALDQYMDIRHYCHRFNDLIVMDIYEGKNLVTKDNSEAFLDSLQYFIDNLDINVLMN